jgi:nucleotide-binding universal stress UspA family protein
MIRIRNILAPTDFSAPSLHACKYAKELASRFQAHVHLITVVESTVPLVPEAGLLFSHQADKLLEQQKAARTALEKFAADPMFGDQRPRLHVLAGNPHKELLEFAKNHEIDLIVVGTHGRSGLSHLLMGSVAEKIVRLASCPVLTVRPEGHQFVSSGK